MAPPRGGEDYVKSEAAKVKPGMSRQQIEGLFGKPEAVVESDRKGKSGTLYQYKKIDKQYELWVRFAGDSATWAMSWDKSEKPFKG